MFPSIQVQLTGPLPNLLDQTCLEIRKVHKVQLVQKIINPDINLDFEENSSFQEGVISEAYQRLDKSFFQEPKELNNLINTGNLIQKFLPKQADIDKILKVIQRKVLKGTHLPVEIKTLKLDI